MEEGIQHLALGISLLYLGFSLGLLCLFTRHRKTLFTSFALGAIGFGLIAVGLI